VDDDSREHTTGSLVGDEVRTVGKRGGRHDRAQKGVEFVRRVEHEQTVAEIGVLLRKGQCLDLALHLFEIVGPREEAKETEIRGQVLEAADQLCHRLPGSIGLVGRLRCRRCLGIRLGRSGRLLGLVGYLELVELVELVDEKDGCQARLAHPLDDEWQLTLQGLDGAVDDERVVLVALLPGGALHRRRDGERTEETDAGSSRRR
jgi:hypothetical protein